MNNSSLLNAIIIDDELNAINVLEQLLDYVGSVKVIAKETNPNKGLRQIIIHKPDVVFLDIDMPEKNGISLLKELRELNIDIKVIIVSSHEEYTFEAFKNAAIDFLLKPVVIEDLKETVQRLLKPENKQHIKKASGQLDTRDKIKLTTGSKTLLIKPSQAIYFKADGNYTNVQLTGNKTELITAGIGKIEKMLPDNFKKISRSIIINSDYLVALVKRNRICILNHENNEYQLKASMNLFYDLEKNIF